MDFLKSRLRQLGGEKSLICQRKQSNVLKRREKLMEENGALWWIFFTNKYDLKEMYKCACDP